MNSTMIMTSLSVDDLGDLIEARLKKILKDQRPEAAPAPVADEVFNTKQAASFLSLAEPTLYTLTSKRAIPCMKKGKRLYFSKAALVEWLKQGQRPTSQMKEK